MPGVEAFEALVKEFYSPLYRFALSLAHSENDADDLTQQTFYVWANKGHQLRNPSKIKTWLFTTLYHEHLRSRRRHTRFPHQELSEADAELPAIMPDWTHRLDGRSVVALLEQVDDMFRAPVALFYLEEVSYKEIAEILDIPLGTVKSRISRGVALLQRLTLRDEPRPRRPDQGPLP